MHVVRLVHNESASAHTHTHGKSEFILLIYCSTFCRVIPKFRFPHSFAFSHNVIVSRVYYDGGRWLGVCVCFGGRVVDSPTGGCTNLISK